MERAPELENMLNSIFPERKQRLEHGLCVTCGGKVDKAVMSELELKELGISGMCKACQDKVFSEEA